jgi:transcriptional repressor NrdR
VDDDALALLAQQVEEDIRSRGCAEVDAHAIGTAILTPLRDLDEVAYLRFASVYKEFASLEDFEAEIADLRARCRLTADVPRYGGAHDPAPPPVPAAALT